MSNREFTATRTMLANAMATAGAELLEYMGVSSALAAIPNTEPPQYVVAGTLAMIAKVLPAAPVPPLTAPAPLTDDNLIADLTEFTERSIREHADFRDDIERLSTADRRTRKALRKEIYDTIDTRVRNAVKASLAAKAAPAAPVQTAEPEELTDEAIDEVWGAMPGGTDGWLKQFGYRQFARSIARHTLVRVAASMAGTIRPSDDELWEQTIGERDTYHEWADKLANAVAAHFGAEIGEHSNMNCPWAEALEVIESAPVQAEQAQAAAVRAAYESAAHLCETIGTDWLEADDAHKNFAADYLAKQIRALAAPSTATSNDTAALGDTGGDK